MKREEYEKLKRGLENLFNFHARFVSADHGLVAVRAARDLYELERYKKDYGFEQNNGSGSGKKTRKERMGAAEYTVLKDALTDLYDYHTRLVPADHGRVAEEAANTLIHLERFKMDGGVVKPRGGSPS